MGRPSPWPAATHYGPTAHPNRSTTWTSWWLRPTFRPPPAALEKVGFGIERPPEDWLFKAHIGDAVVDVLHRVNGVIVEPSTLDCAQDRVVLAITMPVLPPTTVFIQQLRALTEHYCDFARLIPAARAVREQLDWDRIAADTAENHFAAAFLMLVDRLGLRE